MIRQAKASSAGSNQRQAAGLGRSAIHLPFMLGALLAAALLTLAFAVPSAHAAKAWIPEETFGPSNQPTFDTARSTLATDDDGRLYVFNHAGPDTLSRWNPDGTPADFAALGTNVIDGAGGGPDQTPQGSIGGRPGDQVAVDNSGPLGVNDGNIYLSDQFDELVNIFDADGTYLGQLTASDQGPLGGPRIGDGPQGVAVDDDGAVYVSDPNRGAVQKYEPTAKPPVNADNTASFSIRAPSIDQLGQLAAGDGPTDGYIFLGGPEGIRKVDATSGSIQYTVSSRSYKAVAVAPISGTVFGFGESTEATNFTEYDASGTGGATVLAHVQDAGGGLIQGIAPFNAGENLYFHRGDLANVQIWEAVASQEVETGPPALISGAKATVTGTVKPFGTTLTECFFEYDTAPYPEGQPAGTEAAPAHGQSAPCDPDAASIPADGGSYEVSGELTGMLANGATYHYRLVTNGVASVFGQGRSFKTATTYTTDPASGLTGTEATLNGTVKPEGVELTDCHFEYGTAFLSSSAPCEPDAASIPNTDSDVPVSLALSDLEPGATYRFRLVAENSLGKLIGEERTFTVKGKPVVEQQPIDVTQTTATLQAQINPAGSDTTFHFEWGPDTSYGNRIPANFEQGAGEGTVPVLRTGFVSGLQPASTYHFRVIASNAFGTTVGPDQPFQTLAANGLLDNRAFELVTPADKGSSALISLDASEQQSFQASPDGESFIYPLLNGLDSSTAGGWLRQRAGRTDEGWLSSQISAPSLVPHPGHGGERKLTSRFHYSAPDNSCGFLETHNPITADTPHASVERGVTNLYRWSADGSYELVTHRLPLNNFPASVYYSDVDASEDCSRVYFQTDYEFISGASGLYEWDEGTLRDAGLLPPSGNVASGPVLGGAVGSFDPPRWNAVSPDGSRVFFTANAPAGSPSSGKAIFMREERGASYEECEEKAEFDDCVVEISASETAVPTNGARFEAASADGGRVILAANYGIAGTTSAGPTNGDCGPTGSGTIGSGKVEAKPCDLYAYDVETGELTDLSADANPDDPIGAAIQGAVAIDDDGSHVYFAALGQLVLGEGRTYQQNTEGFGSANVYLHRDGEPLSYVTTLAEHGKVGDVTAGDLFGIDGRGAALMRLSFAAWTANTTPDGAKLLFMSSLPLTGYDTGGRDRSAAYLYSADTGKLTCVSCRPDGLPSLLKDDPGVFLHQSTWLLRGPGKGYRPRSISEDGSRVFFTSPDVLAVGAMPGSRNVYQWQQGQVSLLAVGDPGGVNGVWGYLDSTPSGDSVFLGSKEQLVPWDRDFVSDVYSVRVDGGFPFTPDPPECQVNESIALEANQIYCQGEKSAQPGDTSPPSAGFAGPGNVREKTNPCTRRARRARALSKRAKALRRRAKRASSAKATRRNANRARRAAKAARRNSNAAKRCRRRTRSANTNRGGNR